MPRLIDLTGKRFGRLVVIHQDGFSKRGKAMWLCKCDCGGMKSIASYSLRRGVSRSCGCLRRETARLRNITHGKTGTSTYRVWLRMRRRCNDRNSTQYKWYGGCGIKICKRWNNFSNFLKDMGEHPKGMTLDRKNNSRDYSPSNCRWASWQEQQNNRRNNHKLMFDGRLQTVADWSREIGIPYATILARVNRYGWSVERALTELVNQA